MNGKLELREHGVFRGSIIELCNRGLLTCTYGNPGEPGATYALGWLSLDNPESFTEQVREQHAENMKRLRGNEQ